MTDASRTVLCAVCVLCAACAPTVAPTPLPIIEPVPAVAAPEDPTRVVLYADEWAGWDVRLVGVDAAGSVAVVRLTDRDAPLRVLFDTVDLRSGARLERWEASPECTEGLVRGDAVYTCIDGAADDLDRYAELLRRVGPWQTRGTLSHPVVAAGPGAVAALRAPDEGDGDWIVVETGGTARRVGAARASYDPVWTPDGAMVFRVCGVRPGGCAWSLWIRDKDGAVRELADVAPQRPPVLSPGGETVWVVTGRSADCLTRVGVDGVVAQLGCFEPDSRVRISDVDADGVVFAPVDGGLSLRWLMDGGEVAQARVVRGATGMGPLAAGRAAVGTVDGWVTVVELPTGRQVELKPAKGRYAGLAQARWTPRGLVVLETYEGGFSIVGLRP